MKAPNPLSPQGAFQQQSKAKSAVRLAVLGIVAVHALVFAALLSLSFVQGCKPSSPTTVAEKPAETNLIDIGLPAPGTNLEVATPLPATKRPTILEPLPPVPAPAPTPLPATEYVVKKGDLFGRIAGAHGVSTQSLAKANPSINPDRIFPGQKLQIPAQNAGASPASPESPNVAFGDSHIVKGGETLTKIATIHGTTIKAIKEANQLKTDRIHVGDKLKIPGASGTESTPTTSAPTLERVISRASSASNMSVTSPDALPPINLPQSSVAPSPAPSSGSGR